MATLSRKSAADYKYLAEMTSAPFEIVGVGMGEGGDYALLRGEDVAFFWEAMNEIAAVEQKFENAKKNAFDGSTPTLTAFDTAPKAFPAIDSAAVGINWLTRCQSYASRFYVNVPTAPSNYAETIKHVAVGPTSVEPNVANLPIAIFGETGLPTFTRSLNYTNSGAEADPSLPSFTNLLRADIIKALYRDFALNDGLYVEFYNCFSRAQAYTIARNDEVHTVRYLIDGTNPTKTDSTTTTPESRTGVTGTIQFDAKHNAYWDKEHQARLQDDGSIAKYTDTRFEVVREGFVIHAAGDIYVNLPTSTGAEDIEIVDAKWWAVVELVRESYTEIGLDVRWDTSGKLISRKEPTRTRTKTTRYIVVPCLMTKAEAVEDYRVRYTLDVEVPAAQSYLDEYETLASTEGFDLGMESAAKAAFDASTGEPTLGSGEAIAIVTDSGQENFTGRIFRVCGYLKLARKVRVTD